MTALEKAAYLWWVNQRPAQYTTNDHLINPDVNCVSAFDRTLAHEVANHFKDTQPEWPAWCNHISTNSAGRYFYNCIETVSWNHCPKCGKARPV